MLDLDRYRLALADTADAMTTLINVGDLDAPVQACPGWSLADLVRHLGSVHRWAAEILRTGEPDDRVEAGPAGRGDLAAWFAEGASALLDRLGEVDPGRPTWTFGPEPRVAAFWWRRQAQETLIHGWDAAASQGAGLPISADLALDGIDEIVTMFFPRQVRLGRTSPLAAGLAIVADEQPERTFLLAGAGDTTGGEAIAAATLTGPASDLLLVLWHRQDTSSVCIEGDLDVAGQILGAAIVP